MADRIFAFTVLLDCDMRDDDAEAIITALRMVKHVQSVKAHVAHLELWAAETRVKAELLRKMMHLFEEEADG